MSYRSGRHFLQIPGPTNVPDRILRAMARPTIDHRGPEFRSLAREVLDGIRAVFQTQQPVVIYPASGTGAWEAALVNTLSRGDQVLMVETGHFATLWRDVAADLGLDPVFIPGDWRHGVDPDEVQSRLAEDSSHAIKAVCVVHNETSTGVANRIPLVRKAIDRAGHPALFHGGHHFVAGVDGLSPRRVGGRRDGWSVAEGADAAARPELQCCEREGPAGSCEGRASAELLGLGAGADGQREGDVPVYPCDQPSVWTT